MTVALGATIGVESGAFSAVLEALGKVSWSTLVCLGVLLGLSLPRVSLRSAAGWGFLSAPLAFGVRFVALSAWLVASTSVLQLAPTIVNEVLFPGFCALLIWTTMRARRLIASPRTG